MKTPDELKNDPVAARFYTDNFEKLDVKDSDKETFLDLCCTHSLVVKLREHVQDDIKYSRQLLDAQRTKMQYTKLFMMNPKDRKEEKTESEGFSFGEGD